MATYRVHATKDYTIMSNAHLRDRDMSLKAKGLLSIMLSLPENWDYTMNGLCAICKENITAVKAALNELRELGYLVITKKLPNETESGRIEYVYDIYETRKQAIEKQGIENLPVENLPIENHIQSITNELNTDKENIKELNIKHIGDKRFVPPSVEEVRAYCLERKNGINAEQFVDYYESNGWKVGKNKMKDWKASVRTWERNRYGGGQAKTYGQNGIAIKAGQKDEFEGMF